MARKKANPEPVKAGPLKLDLGAGKTKRDGFIPVDVRKFDDDVVVVDLAHDPWPWKDNSVDEVFSSHMLEHLDAEDRAHFANELYRVLKPAPAGATEPKATFVTPHWASARAYGDPTHKWPPICEYTFAYWNKAWRDLNAPHDDVYTCDFENPPPTYTLHPYLQTRAVEHQQERLAWAKEAAQDMIQVLIKREKP